MRCGWPAVRAQDTSDVSCALAPVLAQFRETEPERDDAVEQIAVVTALVSPLLILGMRGGSVELHAYAVLLIEVVEVPVAGALPDPCLPGRDR